MSDKVALVTGGSRGIGAACAKKLGQNGYKVLVHYRSGEEEATQVASEIPDAQIIQADLGDADACAELIKKVKADHGGLDVLVNNAGMCIDQLLMFAKPDDFEKLFQVNVRSVFLLSKFGGKLMARKKKGRIINITSVVGFTGNGGQSMYATTKAAIVGFTKSIAAELAGFGITCNCVAPGFIATDMTAGLDDATKELILASVPLKRLGTPEEIANAVNFLASDEASYITGSTIHVNGGMYTN